MSTPSVIHHPPLYSVCCVASIFSHVRCQTRTNLNDFSLFRNKQETNRLLNYKWTVCHFRRHIRTQPLFSLTVDCTAGRVSRDNPVPAFISAVTRLGCSGSISTRHKSCVRRFGFQLVTQHAQSNVIGSSRSAKSLSLSTFCRQQSFDKPNKATKIPYKV